jgi:hypothetical protein
MALSKLCFPQIEMKSNIVATACTAMPSARVKENGQSHLPLQNLHYQKQQNRQIFSSCNSPNRLPDFFHLH